MIRELTPSDFDAVIALGLLVHGEGYLDWESLNHIYHQGIKNDINANFVAVEGEELLGFRLTYAPGQWQFDPWCSISLWGVPAETVCYFKSNTLAESARGKGLGGKLLAASIAAVKCQGARAGVAHLWKESPHNAAVRYFAKAGARLIKEHPGRWNQAVDNPHYVCVRCGYDCHCTACEMLLRFDDDAR
jgi:GNAT superfamily N-acetyltransferase